MQDNILTGGTRLALVAVKLTPLNGTVASILDILSSFAVTAR